MIDNLVSFCEAMAWLGLFGLAYLLVRGRRRLDIRLGPFVAVAAAFAIQLLAFSLFGRASERYYRVLAPPAFALAGGGLYTLWVDLERRPVLRYALLGLLVVICLAVALHEPIRAHRRPQMDVGRWLRQHDPEYDGFVLSSYPQPVYCAGMRYLPSTRYGSRRVFKQLTRAGYWPRYVILDGDDAEDFPWLGELVQRPVWKLVHSEPERNIRIFEHTVRRRPPPARPTEAD